MAIYTGYYNKSICQIDKYSPKVVLKKPWITRALLTSCNKKNKLYLNYKKHPTSNNKAKYLKYRNKFKELKLAAEKIYYEHGRRPGAEFGGDQKIFSRPNFRKNVHFRVKISDDLFF